MTDYISNYARGKQYLFHFYSVVSGDTVSFPALLTQLDNKFSPSWNSEKVFGRQDPILTFQGTERTMAVAFDVPSESKSQAKRNLTKLNKLINFLYPAFSRAGSANTISASPLFRIKFANLIYDQSKGVPGNNAQSGLVCGINDFSHSFKFDGSAGWVDEVGLAIPALFSISFSATILHTHDLGHINGSYRPYSEFPYFVRETPEEELMSLPPEDLMSIEPEPEDLMSFESPAPAAPASAFVDTAPFDPDSSALSQTVDEYRAGLFPGLQARRQSVITED